MYSKHVLAVVLKVHHPIPYKRTLDVKIGFHLGAKNIATFAARSFLVSKLVPGVSRLRNQFSPKKWSAQSTTHK